MKKLNVLSLFDGMSCGRIALDRAGLEVGNYFASEIDKHAVAVAKHNYPSTTHIGDVTKVKYHDGKLFNSDGDVVFEGAIDMVIGGSPCQSISNLGNGAGLDGKSGLFFEYLRLLTEVNPKYFLLENVVGSKKAVDRISELVDVQPVLFNSNIVSAQNRSRYYWTNIKFELPSQKNIFLKDILDTNPKDTCELTHSRFQWLTSEKGQICVSKKYAAIDPEKANCLTARSDVSWNCNYVTRDGYGITKLTCEEYEKLQTVPVGYTSTARTSERYKMLGNGWTVDVIAHIFKHIKD